MARNDGCHRTVVRHVKLRDGDVRRVQSHNERERESYYNQDIVKERTLMNVHFKNPSADYTSIFEQMVRDKKISIRGLKAGACKVGELVFDVNSAYFHDRGGYDFAKQFYAEAYKAAIDIVGGEQYIISAVMHADEQNRALSHACQQDVYHYHLHVVYVPVVSKEICWTRRCKDRDLVGKVKEEIVQVNMSKKWDSKPLLGEDGTPLRTASGKLILKNSYSLLQDDFYNHMYASGYTDLQRGERGSSQEHLSITRFKIMKAEENLEELKKMKTVLQAEISQMQEICERKTFDLKRLDEIKTKPSLVGNKVMVDKYDFEMIALAAKTFIAQEKKETALQQELGTANIKIAELKRTVADLNEKLTIASKELTECQSVWEKICVLNLENEQIREKIRKYEEVISHNNLKSYFYQPKEMDSSRDDER